MSTPSPDDGLPGGQPGGDATDAPAALLQAALQAHEYRTDVRADAHHSLEVHFRALPPEHAAVADPASEGDDVLHLLNSTDGELSGLSHLDAPISDSVYIVCGVLIAMVLVGLIIVLLAVTISKLRKREETNNNSLGHAPTRTHQLQQLQQLDAAKTPFSQSQTGNGVAALEVPTVVTAAITTTTAVAASAPVAAAPVCPDSADSASSGPDSADGEDEPDGKAPLELFLWSYPNQLQPFSGTKDALVREIPCEVPQDSKGLRKNLRGKWKRLVKKKPEDTCSIPPELRDQLKQIYVY